ncbi:MAG: ABC transporter permease subunit [Deltaproteobacteria bacterium]|nr:ABC transporter permease subunit [Deltaproteobacteria bacterium]
MWHSVLLITRHELAVAVRTRRALFVSALYLGAAILGGLAFVVLVRFFEHEVVARLSAQGMGGPAANLDVLGAEAYQKLAAFFAGVEPEAVAASFKNAVVVPFFFWGSLVFLPFLIVLSSFDQVAGDLQSRAILYPTLRARRLAILLGKVAAQLVLLVAVSIAGAVALVAIAALMLRGFSVVQALPAVARMVVLLVPFGLSYLAITAFASVSTKQPFAALFGAFAIMVALRVLGFMSVIPEDHPAAWLRPLTWLSPSTYQSGLWLDDLSGPLSSVAAYLGFAAVFLTLAALVLERRDL